MITFDNIYGKFELEKGLRFNFNINSLEAGGMLPLFDAKVVGETSDELLIEKFGVIEKIKKEYIFEVEANKDSN